MTITRRIGYNRALHAILGFSTQASLVGPALPLFML